LKSIASLAEAGLEMWLLFLDMRNTREPLSGAAAFGNQNQDSEGREQGKRGKQMQTCHWPVKSDGAGAA